MTTHANTPVPAEVFPPGEFLADALEDRGWTQSEFAQLIRRPVQLVNEIIAGKRAITPTTAKEIAIALDTSPTYWLNLENAYQLSRAPAPDEAIAREAKLRGRFPVREMIKRGWLQAGPSFEATERNVFAFFEIEHADEPLAMAHAARRDYEKSLSELQWAWIYRVKQLASTLRIRPFSQSLLQEALPKLEGLLLEAEEIRHVPRILSECGVRFVIVEPIPGSNIHGVCFWLDDKSPVIGLTLKWDYIDRVWFNLRHEIEHVLRGDGKTAPITDDFDEQTASSQDEAEVAANKAAADFCVPSKLLRSFVIRHDPMFSTQSFVGFSRLVKRHPGIVAGQLQRQINRNDLFRKHQVRVRELLIQTALTDGYGQIAPSDLSGD